MLQPNGGPENYKTYQVLAPLSTHFRQATCREVECEGFKHGFRTIVPSDSPQATYLRSKIHGRVYTESSGGAGLAQFDFPPGQSCFRSTDHRISLEREPFYFVKDGDYRGNPFGTRPVRREAEDWVDDFATHQQRVHDAVEKG